LVREQLECRVLLLWEATFLVLVVQLPLLWAMVLHQRQQPEQIPQAHSFPGHLRHLLQLIPLHLALPLREYLDKVLPALLREILMLPAQEH
jgi:hypothetical protein